MSELATRHLLPPQVPGRARATVAVATAALVVALALAAVPVWPTRASPAWSATTLFAGEPHSLQMFAGTPHLFASSPSGAVYATCDGGCDNASRWRSTVVDPDGRFGVLRLDRGGRPRLFYFGADATFRYAECDSNCTATSSWRRTVIDRDTQFWRSSISLAIDDRGAPHVAYGAARPGTSPTSFSFELMYARCDVSCTDASSWRSTNLSSTSADKNFDGSLSLALVGDAPRLVYTDSVFTGDSLNFTACDVNCLTARSWRSTKIPDPWDLSYNPSLVMDGDRAHVAYMHTEQPGMYPSAVHLSYASCSGGCAESASWEPGVSVGYEQSPVAVDPLREEDTLVQLAVAGGKPRIAHTLSFILEADDVTHTTAVRYAWCDTACGSTAGWSDEQPSVVGGQTTRPTIAVDGERPRLAFLDYADDPEGRTGVVRYAWCDEVCGAPATSPSSTTTSSTTTPTSSSTTTTSTTSTTTTTTSTTSTTTTTTTLAHAVTPAPTTTTTMATTHQPAPTTTTTTPSRHQTQPQRAPRAGHWLVGEDGGVFTAGDAPFLGSTGARRLNQPIVGMAATPASKGYWFAARDGGIFAFGDAPFLGSTGAIALNQPIVATTSTPTGKGYWLTAADGGIFAFGDAPFLGSTGAITLNQPIVGMAPTPTGNGYWLVARDGGIFAFGDAPFLGSTGAIALNQPIVGMAARPQGDGYWFAAADGGVFTFGAARYHGSAASRTTAPVIGLSATPAGSGYTLAAADGTTYAFGDATAFAPPPSKPAHPIVGIAAIR